MKTFLGRLACIYNWAFQSGSKTDEGKRIWFLGWQLLPFGCLEILRDWWGTFLLRLSDAWLLVMIRSDGWSWLIGLAGSHDRMTGFAGLARWVDLLLCRWWYSKNGYGSIWCWRITKSNWLMKIGELIWLINFHNVWLQKLIFVWMTFNEFELDGA